MLRLPTQLSACVHDYAQDKVLVRNRIVIHEEALMREKSSSRGFVG